MTVFDQLTGAFQLYAPRIVGALVLFIVAWIVAAIVRTVIRRVGEAVRLDERARSNGLTNTLATLGFYLVWLFFLPGILDALQLPGLLLPVQGLLNRVLAFLPNLIGAALILFIGLLVARVLREVVSNLLSAVGLDRLGERVGLAQAGQRQLSDLVGLIVYILVLIPALTAALDALGLPAITAPISNMLNTFLAALPNIFAAGVLLTLAFFVGRFVAQIVTRLLTDLGINTLPARLGLARAAAPGGQSLAQIVGNLVLVVIMLFAAVEASRLLGFATLTALVGEFLVLVGQIVLGLVILAIGLYLANLAYNSILGSGMGNANLLAPVARVAIIVLSGAMALRQMGLASEIVNLAFGLTLGAIAVAAALAFGLGGRETAGRLLERWQQQAEARANQPPPPPTSSSMLPPTPGPSVPPTPRPNVPPMPPQIDRPTAGQ